jgi:hypothetical protein
MTEQVIRHLPSGLIRENNLSVYPWRVLAFVLLRHTPHAL